VIEAATAMQQQQRGFSRMVGPSGTRLAPSTGRRRAARPLRSRASVILQFGTHASDVSKISVPTGARGKAGGAGGPLRLNDANAVAPFPLKCIMHR
jgi:hypothetical protein